MIRLRLTNGQIFDTPVPLDAVPLINAGAKILRPDNSIAAITQGNPRHMTVGGSETHPLASFTVDGSYLTEWNNVYGAQAYAPAPPPIPAAPALSGKQLALIGVALYLLFRR